MAWAAAVRDSATDSDWQSGQRSSAASAAACPLGVGGVDGARLASTTSATAARRAPAAIGQVQRRISCRARSRRALGHRPGGERADHAVTDHAAGIDEVRLRGPGDAEVERQPAIVGDVRPASVAVAVEPAAGRIGRVVVEDADDLDRVAEARRRVEQHGVLVDARRAPAGPEVDDGRAGRRALVGQASAVERRPARRRAGGLPTSGDGMVARVAAEAGEEQPADGGTTTGTGSQRSQRQAPVRRSRSARPRRYGAPPRRPRAPARSAAPARWRTLPGDDDDAPEPDPRHERIEVRRGWWRCPWPGLPQQGDVEVLAQGGADARGGDRGGGVGVVAQRGRDGARPRAGYRSSARGSVTRGSSRQRLFHQAVERDSVGADRHRRPGAAPRSPGSRRWRRPRSRCHDADAGVDEVAAVAAPVARRQPPCAQSARPRPGSGRASACRARPRRP